MNIDDGERVETLFEIVESKFRNRARSACRRLGVSTFGDLCKESRCRLIGCREVGPSTIAALERALRTFGRTLSDDSPRVKPQPQKTGVHDVGFDMYHRTRIGESFREVFRGGSGFQIDREKKV